MKVKHVAQRNGNILKALDSRLLPVAFITGQDPREQHYIRPAQHHVTIVKKHSPLAHLRAAWLQ